MRKLFSTKKRIVATVGTVALVAAMAGGAFAYFTASGTGTGTAYVGAGSNFTVTVGRRADTSTRITPSAARGRISSPSRSP